MTAGPSRTVRPVAGELLHEAVGRLLYGNASPPPEAVTGFIEGAADLGIDLGLISAVVDPDAGRGRRVRQACMPVLGAGRTVMIFVSGPGVRQSYGSEAEQAGDRADAVLSALRRTREAHGERAGLVQALAEPGETWAIEAYRAAGLRQIAELLYLSRPLRPGEARAVLDESSRVWSAGPDSLWPPGVTVRSMRADQADELALERALELSYIDTMDCPELAGLRTLPDIVASHRAVGDYDPALWWLVELGGRPEGCVLLNRCPEQHCVELVYIGLSTRLRGVSLGAALMECAIAASSSLERELRCAVDARNTPARRMYGRLGFREVGKRIAFIAPLGELLGPNVPRR